MLYLEYVGQVWPLGQSSKSATDNVSPASKLRRIPAADSDVWQNLTSDAFQIGCGCDAKSCHSDASDASSASINSPFWSIKYKHTHRTTNE